MTVSRLATSPHHTGFAVNTGNLPEVHDKRTLYGAYRNTSVAIGLRKSREKADENFKSASMKVTQDPTASGNVYGIVFEQKTPHDLRQVVQKLGVDAARQPESEQTPPVPPRVTRDELEANFNQYFDLRDLAYSKKTHEERESILLSLHLTNSQSPNYRLSNQVFHQACEKGYDKPSASPEEKADIILAAATRKFTVHNVHRKEFDAKGMLEFFKGPIVAHLDRAVCEKLLPKLEAIGL